MRCEVAERTLSARMDGADDPRKGDALEAHLATCSRCRAFAARAERLRVLARFEPVEPIPDLVPSIMGRVRAEAAGRRGAAPVRVARGWPRYAVAFAAGLVAAAVLVGGLPGLRRGPAPALAIEIPRRIAAASTEVTAYRAEFRIEELGYHTRVPVRSFTARVTFRAPERFRAALTDTSTYPSGRWPRNNVVLAVDADRWLLDGPAICPREALPACATGGREVRLVTGREPFDGDAFLPTDIVLPVRTLVGTERVRVVGEGSVLGRDAVIVELAYRDAVPLFSYLQAGGSWRPFYPHDRVLVSLDAESWFPLAYQVLPAPGIDRARWADRNGLTTEDPGEPVFRATATSFQAGAPRGWRPMGPPRGAAADHGFRDRGFEEVGTNAVLPADTAGLEPYRGGTFVGGGRPGDETLVSFTRGLAWLNVRQTRSWDQPELFGDVGDLAARVALPGGGVGYYEPATAARGRRLSIHAAGVDLYLETNLPRDALLRVAGSVPVTAREVPVQWLERRWPGGIVRAQVTLAQARAVMPKLLVPSRLPSGYRPWTVHVVTSQGGSGVAVFFRRPGAELDGGGIRLFQAAGQTLAPPMDPDVVAVRVRGVTGRYSPTRGELEWVEDGVYRALGGTALDLGGLLAVAGSLEEPR